MSYYIEIRTYETTEFAEKYSVFSGKFSLKHTTDENTNMEVLII
jgi:hypothetical protein